MNNESTYSRRRFLKYAVGAVAGVAGMGAVGASTGMLSAVAAPADAGSKIGYDKFTHNGRVLEIMSFGSHSMLSVDGVEQGEHVFCKTDSGYASHLLCYSHYNKPRDLAKALVDHDGTLYKLT